ncbi:hypothetical protein VNO78_05850 [Psophocarpus tetragonolobus]|uniref:Uncharacterized protein n=1 Tax=Psophocarpus tetragonolobus TaxID=3891 RepID=A0AAN9XR19_PSOTE
MLRIKLNLRLQNPMTIIPSDTVVVLDHVTPSGSLFLSNLKALLPSLHQFRFSHHKFSIHFDIVVVLPYVKEGAQIGTFCLETAIIFLRLDTS